MMQHQMKYVKEILKRSRMDDLNHASSIVEPNLKLENLGEEDKVDVTLFKQIIGSLRYVYNSRPYIGFLVILVSRYMDEPKVSHMKATRRILRHYYIWIFQIVESQQRMSIKIYLLRESINEVF